MPYRRILLISCALFLAMAGFGIIIPALPFYTARLEGDSHFVGITVGLLMASYSTVQFLAAPLWGRLADHIGRRPVILAGLGGFALSFVLMGIADDLVWLFGGRILGGILAAALVPSSLAAIADLTSDGERGRGMGVAGAAMGLGFVFGPALGALLAQNDDFRLPFFAAAALSALTFVLACFWLPETRATPRDLQIHPAATGLWGGLRFYGTRLWPWLCLTFIQTGIFAALEATLALYCRDSFGLKIADVGMLMALMGLVAAVFSGAIVGALIRHLGEVPTLKLGFVAFGLGFAAASQSTTIPEFVCSMVAIGLGMACMRPSLTSGVSKKASGSEGMALGVLQSCDSLGRIAGPVLGGALYVVDHSLPLVSGAVLTLCALVLAAFTLPRGQGANFKDNLMSH